MTTTYSNKNFDKFILIFAPSDSRHKSSEKNRSRFWQVKSASFYVSNVIFSQRAKAILKKHPIRNGSPVRV